MTRPAALNSTLQEADIWLKDLGALMRTDNVNTSYAALRTVLHALRDRLTVDEAVHLAAQFPMVIRGLFYEGWKPAATPNRIRSGPEFLADIRDRATGHKELDPNWAARCVFQLLVDRVSAGEIGKVVAMLPPDLRAFWPSAGPSGANARAEPSA